MDWKGRMIGPRELGITAKSFFGLVFRTGAEEGQNAASRLAGMASSRKDRNRTQLDGRNRMGEMIQVKRPDGKTCPAYLVAPKTANAPGFVCIQEYWGLNDQIKKTADRFAEAGYRALVPDLYRGKVAKAADEAAHMMSNLNFPDAAEQDIRGALQHLKQRSKKKVAVGGFCMGGALTLLAALRVPEMDAGACFYGLPPVDPAEFKKIKIPLICHFANQDDWCTPARVNELENMLKQSKSSFEIYRYDAKHAFMNEARPEVYHTASAKLAWDRTLSFLKKALA
jgi:carboxymethylenebutenolidase